MQKQMAYLLVQQQAANGFEKMDPFLVSLPMVEDGTYIYQVDASPKLEIEKAEVPPKQPKTGDTTSSAPYVALAGLSLCIIAVVGRILYVRNRQNHYGE